MLLRRPAATWLVAVLLTATALSPASADVKGRSYSMYANLPNYGVNPVTHCDSGWLDRATGGARSSYKGNISYGNILRCDYMESDSHGDRCKGRSSSKLEAGWIGKGMPFEVTWTHMESADDDTCCAPQDRDDIPSVFVGLTFAGQCVTVTGRQNQTLSVPGVATLILNEVKHDDDTDCDNDDAEHHALHLILKNGNEVILGASKFDSDDDCCMVTPGARPTWGMVKAHYR
ncbi:MAG: choice-of-anchor P family protein [Candidatus Eisenbacteria bacterium]